MRSICPVVIAMLWIVETFFYLPKNLANDFCLFQGLTDFLLKGLQFTHFSAKHMMSGTPVGDAFK